MRVFLRVALAFVAIAWAAFGLIWAIFLVLPSPFILIWVFSGLVSEFSLLLGGFALVGICLALVVRSMGFRRTAIFAGLFGIATVVLCFVPVVSAFQTARDEGVSLSLPKYFSGLSSVAAREPTETVTYASPGGEDLTLDVWEPEGGGGDLPAIVMVHGGSWEIGQRSFARRPAWLADQGYVVFDIAYRLAPPPRFEDAPADVKCAAGWVEQNAAEYGANPERVAIMGDSAGGHLALLAAYTEGNPEFPPSCDVPEADVDAVVALYPPTDMATLCESNRPAWYPKLDCGSIYRFMGGMPEELPERYRAASPTAHISPDSPPTFMVHGGRDQIVLPEQSRILKAGLDGAGVPNRRLEIPYADHAYDLSWGGWGNQITNQRLEDFLDEHFPVEEES